MQLTFILLRDCVVIGPHPPQPLDRQAGEKTLDLPARSRFGKGRAETSEISGSEVQYPPSPPPSPHWGEGGGEGA
jgi:hypothetical protein